MSKSMDQLDQVTEDLTVYILDMHRLSDRLTFSQRHVLATILKSILQLLVAFKKSSNL